MTVSELAPPVDPPGSDLPPAAPAGAGEWGLLLVPVLLSLAMIVAVGVAGT